MAHQIPTPEIGSVIKIQPEGWKTIIECRVKARIWNDTYNECILILDSPEAFTSYTQDSLISRVQRVDIHLGEKIILKQYILQPNAKCHVVSKSCIIF